MREIKFPFQEYAWDDHPKWDHSWVDGAEAKKAYVELLEQTRALADALDMEIEYISPTDNKFPGGESAEAMENWIEFKKKLE